MAQGRWGLSLFLALGGAVSPAWAFRGGPFAGLSASPSSIAQSGSGGNCTLCHDLNPGTGQVRVLGVPANYDPDAIYNLILRVSDPVQNSAGFQLSVENGPFSAPAPQGTLFNSTSLTQFASGVPEYLTQTLDGFNNATANWVANGNAAEFPFQWQAPSSDVGLIRFFAVGNAVNRNMNPFGDRMYISTKTIRPRPSGPGDADRDGDVDAEDWAAFAACWSGPELAASVGCEFFDPDLDTDVDLVDLAFLQEISTGVIPVDYTNADATHGGKLYDKWWTELRLPPPAGNHPLYPPAGAVTGPDTFRCKECHGWDYQGVSGQYGSGTHFTGIPGVLGASQSPQELFDLLKFDTNVTSNGHGMGALGIADQDLWDLTRFVRTELLNTDDHIDSKGGFAGNFDEGLNMYEFHCAGCHMSDGTGLNFGTAQDPEYVGTVAVQNPWEFLHKIRFGHPGAPMISLVDLFTPIQSAVDLGTYAQSLPTQ